MSNKPEAEETPPSPPEQGVSQEWLITNEDARRLYMEMVGVEPKRPPANSKAKAEGAPPVKAAASVAKPPELSAIPTCPPIVSAESPRSAYARLGFLGLLALVLAGLLYGVYVYTQPQRKDLRAKARAVGKVDQQALPVGKALAVTPAEETISLTPTLSVVACEPGRSATESLTGGCPFPC